jgi:hypothetical protein
VAGAPVTDGERVAIGTGATGRCMLLRLLARLIGSRGNNRAIKTGTRNSLIAR